MQKSVVAVLKTSPQTVLEDYQRLAEMAGMAGCLSTGAPTILKDNISWHFPFPAANTTPWQLEGSILALNGAGFHDLSCVQNKTVVTDAFKGEDLNHFLPVFRKYHIPVLYNFRNQDMQWVPFRPKARMHVLDRVFPDGIHIPDYFIGKNIVHLPTVKCHIYTGTTGAMKNAFGGLLNTKRHYTHSWIHETLVDLLAIQKEIHPGVFAMMDGTTVGDGPGPRTMRPVVKNFILASADQVAIDAVAAKMMGFDPLSLRYIKIAHDDGLGCGDTKDISVVGEDISNESWGFTVGNNGVSLFGNLAWFGPLRGLQKLFFHTPMVHAFVMGSEIYHDYYRWPLKDKRVFAHWRDNTSWGQMFQQYAGQSTHPAEFAVPE
ncbi:MAG: DUF362 domain-containing protein [Bacteroidota bacterium]